MSTPGDSTPARPGAPPRPDPGDQPARASRDDELIIVGQVGRAHGVRGQVAVTPRTDDPEARFAPGAALATDPVQRGPLTVTDSRMHSGRLLLSFEGVSDRTGAEALRGTMLLVALGERPAIEDPDEFYDTDLVGLRAVDPDGADLGMVAEVIHSPGSDLLAVDVDGREVLVPFVRQIVPTVDVAGGRVVVDAPEGLFDL